jgi:hypothetical protein
VRNGSRRCCWNYVEFAGREDSGNNRVSLALFAAACLCRNLFALFSHGRLLCRLVALLVAMERAACSTSEVPLCAVLSLHGHW